MRGLVRSALLGLGIVLVGACAAPSSRPSPTAWERDPGRLAAFKALKASGFDAGLPCAAPRSGGPRGPVLLSKKTGAGPAPGQAVTGACRVEFGISAEGQVQCLTILDWDAEAPKKAYLEQLQRLRFDPALDGKGCPQPAAITMKIPFILE